METQFFAVAHLAGHVGFGGPVGTHEDGHEVGNLAATGPEVGDFLRDLLLEVGGNGFAVEELHEGE